MKKPILSLLLVPVFLMLFSKVAAALSLLEPPITDLELKPMIQNYHSYTYVVQEDGAARVWVLMDNLQARDQAQVVRYALPENHTGEVLAWYRETGCMDYRQDNCVYYGSTNWQLLNVQVNGRQIEINLPQAKYPGRFGENNTSLGIMFTLNDVTTKTWWGRTVNIQTGSSDQHVANVNIGVYLPEGVYFRDRTQGPNNWAASISESIRSSHNRPTDFDFQSMQSMMLDQAGSGQIYRYVYNLLPGANYSFTFMSSTSVWRLYFTEILISLAWMVAIATVVALLLRLVVGKKSLRWYLAFIGLLVLLTILIGGLLFTIYTAFGNRYNDYRPMPYAGSGDSYGFVTDFENEVVSSEIAPLNTEDIDVVNFD